jgi:preprotein translocase subunit SecY
MKRLLDLTKKLVWTAGALSAAKVVLDASVPMPDGKVLTEYIARAGGPLLELYSLIGGGALARGTPFALGIMPYLSARVFMALAKQTLPTARKLDAKKTKWWTRGLTVGVSLVQSAGYAKFTQALPGAVSHPGLAYTVEMMLVLTSVSTVLMLFAEEATAPDDVKETPLFPLASAETYRDGRVPVDPVYISHPTPIP